MTKNVIPKGLWDLGLVYEDELLSRMSRGKERRTIYEEVIGQTLEIGEYLDFEFYNLVLLWYQPYKQKTTDDPRSIAR